MIGTLIGLTALVPIVGTYIGGLIAFLVLLMVSPHRPCGSSIFSHFAAAENNLIYPRVVGDSLGLPAYGFY